MKKLVKGILDFRKNVRPGYRETFARLALGQSPDTLFIACSDSRVAPNVFASTDPGDMFVIRNVGNIVPPCGCNGLSTADESEAAAIEFAIENLGVSHIVICGHSECGAMQALLKGREKVATPNFKAWLRHGESALCALEADKQRPGFLSAHNRLSQLNVLQQIKNLRSYPVIGERVAQGQLHLHAWWFDLAEASVKCYDSDLDSFVELDEAHARRIMGEPEPFESANLTSTP